ncbi:hypothetical protein SNEBB_006331 [Seison nebaliae]|nr:hypothetical protein SNEBB_006331 [Seison nebaliae]
MIVPRLIPILLLPFLTQFSMIDCIKITTEQSVGGEETNSDLSRETDNMDIFFPLFSPVLAQMPLDKMELFDDKFREYVGKRIAQNQQEAQDIWYQFLSTVKLEDYIVGEDIYEES